MGKTAQQRRGFTLIELLITIVIIGVLSAIGFSAFGPGYMQKARDAKRKSDLQQIRGALEKYYADNGYYPPSSCGYDCNGYYFSTGGTEWIPGLASYLEGRIPVDPINNGTAPWGNGGYTYAYGNVGRNTYPGKFDLTANLENPNDAERCAARCWKFYFNSMQWCTTCGGAYSNQIYEVSPE